MVTVGDDAESLRSRLAAATDALRAERDVSRSLRSEVAELRDENRRLAARLRRMEDERSWF